MLCQICGLELFQLCFHGRTDYLSQKEALLRNLLFSSEASSWLQELKLFKLELDFYMRQLIQLQSLPEILAEIHPPQDPNLHIVYSKIVYFSNLDLGSSL